MTMQYTNANDLLDDIQVRTVLMLSSDKTIYNEAIWLTIRGASELSAIATYYGLANHLDEYKPSDYSGATLYADVSKGIDALYEFVKRGTDDMGYIVESSQSYIVSRFNENKAEIILRRGIKERFDKGDQKICVLFNKAGVRSLDLLTSPIDPPQAVADNSENSVKQRSANWGTW